MTVPLSLGIALTPFLLEDQYFAIPGCSHDCGLYHCILDHRASELDPFVSGHGEHVTKIHLCSRVTGEFLHFDLIARGNFVLLSAGLNDGVNVGTSSMEKSIKTPRATEVRKKMSKSHMI